MSKFTIVKHENKISGVMYTLHRVKFLGFLSEPLQLYKLESRYISRSFDYEKYKEGGFTENPNALYGVVDATSTKDMKIIEESIQFYTAYDSFFYKSDKVKKTRMTLAELKLSRLIDTE